MRGLLEEDMILGRDGTPIPRPGAGGLLQTAGAQQGAQAGPLGWLMTPAGQGLLAGALGMAANAGRGGTWNMIGRGGLAGLSGYQGAITQQQEAADSAVARRWRELQIGQTEDVMRRTKAVEADRARMSAGGGAGAAGAAQPMRPDAGGADSFGVPSMGGVPLYSQAGSMPARSAPPSAASLSNGSMPGGPGGMPAGPQGGRGNASAQVYERMLAEAQLYEKHGMTKQALEYYQRAEQFKPKYSTTPQLMRDPRTNQLVHVMPSEDGSWQVLPFGAKPDVSLQDLGGRVVAVDRNMAQNGESWAKTMTPGEVASNSLGWANNRNSRERLDFDRSQVGKPQLHDGAWFSPPTAQNPQGAVIRPPMPEGMDPKLTEVQGNATQFASRMRDATRTMDDVTKGGAPWASTVERAGYSPEFPNWVPGGQIASAGISAINKATTPEAALQVRQAQDNWITANLRKESGAAIPVPELEAERRKWFPMPGEGDATAKQKAAARRVAEEAMLVQAGPGAKQVSKVLQRADEAGARAEASRQKRDGGNAGKPLPMPSTNAKDFKHGSVYALPNGASGRWDAMNRRFEVVQ